MQGLRESARRAPLRWPQLEEIAFRPRGTPRGEEPSHQRLGPGKRCQYGDRSTVFGDLEGVPVSNLAEVHAQMLAKLSNPDALGGATHVAPCSTLADVRAINDSHSASRKPGRWNAARVVQVLAHYEEQTATEAIAEDEAAFGRVTETTTRVPVKLVPENA